MMRRRSDLPPVEPQPWAALVPPGSCYARLAEPRAALVADDEYAPLYQDARKGRPSLPPALVVLAILLQYHDDCSDAAAEQRVRFDVRWQHALGLGLEDHGFDATVRCHFRRKRLAHGLERSLCHRLANAARAAGLIATGAAQLIDSSHLLGAAGVRDSDTLIRGGSRTLLRALGHTARTRAALGERLGRDLDPAAAEQPGLGWGAATARAACLTALVEDARAALALAGADTNPAATEAGALLVRIVADAVETGPPAGPQRRGRPRRCPPPEPPAAPGTPAGDAPRWRHGVAPDRVVSVVAPEMRVGHKSQRRTWAGDNGHITEAPVSEVITAVEVRHANEHDAAAAVALATTPQAAVGLRPGALLCAGAYGTAAARADLGALGVEVVAKLRPLADSRPFGKDEFVSALAANDGQGSVICPAGVTTTDRRMARDSQGRPGPRFRSPRAVCAACPLRDRCLGGPGGRAAQPVRPPPGRQVPLHFPAAVRQQARAAQRTPEQRRALRERLRPRAKVERTIAALLRRHGLRRGRSIGLAQTARQAVRTATLVNAKRLLTLVASRADRAAALRPALAR